MSAAFGSKASIATPPDKGSFPLDHAGECKSSMKVGQYSYTLKKVYIFLLDFFELHEET